MNINKKFCYLFQEKKGGDLYYSSDRKKCAILIYNSFFDEKGINLDKSITWVQESDNKKNHEYVKKDHETMKLVEEVFDEIKNEIEPNIYNRMIEIYPDLILEKKISGGLSNIVYIHNKKYLLKFYHNYDIERMDNIFKIIEYFSKFKMIPPILDYNIVDFDFYDTKQSFAYVLIEYISDDLNLIFEKHKKKNELIEKVVFLIDQGHRIGYSGYNIDNNLMYSEIEDRVYLVHIDDVVPDLSYAKIDNKNLSEYVKKYITC